MRRSRSAVTVMATVAVTVLTGIAGSQSTLAADTGTARPVAHATLESVSAYSATDAWAVGHRTLPGGPTLALTKHWDGSGWTIVASEHPGEDSFLWGVAALSPTDAWAVGQMLGGATDLPMAEHWDGTSWQLVPIKGGPGLGRLNAVSAAGPDDVWMVGEGFTGPRGTAQRFIAHWDGTSIHRVKAGSLSRGVSSNLTSVTVLAEDDVWAVGTRGRGGSDLSLIEHYDGTAWSVVPGYPVGGASAMLSSVDAIAADSVWAVGWDVVDGDPSYSAFAEHWNGTEWTTTDALRPGYSSLLTGVSAVASDDVWAVGSWVAGEQDRRELPLIEHWDGQVWTIVAPGSDQGSRSATLSSISMSSASDGLAVGAKVRSGLPAPYSLEWDGAAWTR